MKHLFKCIIVATIGVMLFSVSCVEPIRFGDDFLEKPPTTSDLNVDSIFGNAEYARGFLWNTYENLYFGLPFNWGGYNQVKMNTGVFEALSDCWHSHNSWDGVNRHYYSGGYNAGIEDGNGHPRYSFTGDNNWTAIRKAWQFIENVGIVPDMEDSEKERLTAEAKMIIAMRYFDLFRHFGGLPLIEKTYEAQATYELPRATAEATVNFMIRLLDEAIAEDDLPWSLGAESTNWQGRLTKASAMGLKCKILIFAASPLYNDDVAYSSAAPQEAATAYHVWYGGYNAEWWTKCKTACEEFFTALNANGFYGLMQAEGSTIDDYRNAFYKAYYVREDNTELLVSTRAIGQNTNQWWWYFNKQWVGYGGYTPTLEFMEMFPMSDGTPFNRSVHMADGADPFFENNDDAKPIRDPRLYETILVNGETFGDHQAELWVGGRDIQQGSKTESGIYATGMGLFKFHRTGQGEMYNTYPQWPYLRLAEIYLIYAEALLQTGDLQGAINQVDIIRARVGMRGLVESNSDLTSSNKDVILEEILRERACELGFEDVRLFDMIRYKRNDLFKKRLHGLRIYRNDGGGDVPWSGTSGNSAQYPEYPSEFRYEVFELKNVARSWWTSFDSKWYLSAFPPSEVNKGYGLTQNPGW